MVDVIKAMQSASVVFEAIAEIKTGKLGKEFQAYLKTQKITKPWGYGDGYPDDLLVQQWPAFMASKEKQEKLLKIK